MPVSSVRLLCLAILLSVLGFPANAQSPSLERAKNLYTAGSYQEALVAATTSLPEAAKAAGLNNAIGSFLAELGTQEFAVHNFKNAYESYTMALKYSPENSSAVRGFLSIKRTMDVASLKNEAEPKPRAASISPSLPVMPQPPQTTVAAEVIPLLKFEVPVLSLTPLPVPLPPPETPAKVAEVVSPPVSVFKPSSTKLENQRLRDQLDRQVLVARQTQADLKVVIDKQAALAQATPPPNPQIQNLVNAVEGQGRLLAAKSSFSDGLVWFLVASSLLLALLASFILLSAWTRQEPPSLPTSRGLTTHPGHKDRPEASLVRREGSPEDPLGIPALFDIPLRLKEVLKGRDQSVVTAKLCRSIGPALGLSGADTRMLCRTALAHDAGYLHIDNLEFQRILAKPDLTQAEFGVLRSHVSMGLMHFCDQDLPTPIRDGLLHHHERIDGSGYPQGLKGRDIPLFAQILGVAETFVALLSTRPYRAKVDVPQALAIIRDARRKFDRPLVEALTLVSQPFATLS